MSRDALPSVGAFVFALLLVSAAAISGFVPGASPVGDASAEWKDCTLADPLLGAAYNTLIGADSGCRWESGTSADYENMSATDAYASGIAMRDATNSYVSTTGNFLENGRAVAMSKAKIEMVNELNNN